MPQIPTTSFDSIEIIGQGLSGSLLAMELLTREIPFNIIDEPLEGLATPIAPGIVNPLAGHKFKPPPGLSSLLKRTSKSFHHCEKILGETFWHPSNIRRIFFADDQLNYFEKTRRIGEARKFIRDIRKENVLGKDINDDMGSFLTVGGGWVDLPRFQSSVRDFLSSRNLLVEDFVSQDHPPPGVARIDCTGWRVSQDPLWSWLPHNPAKGEMLIVEIPDFEDQETIYNRSCWMQPIGDKKWRVGATYQWEDFSSKPSMDGALELTHRLQDLIFVPFKTVDQVAGVRPIVGDYKPVIGRHPEHSNLFIVNAMGSKGVLQAPTAVHCFLSWFLEQAKLPSDWDVARFKR